MPAEHYSFQWKPLLRQVLYATILPLILICTFFGLNYLLSIQLRGDLKHVVASAALHDSEKAGALNSIASVSIADLCGTADSSRSRSLHERGVCRQFRTYQVCISLALVLFFAIIIHGVITALLARHAKLSRDKLIKGYHRAAGLSLGLLAAVVLIETPLLVIAGFEVPKVLLHRIYPYLLFGLGGAGCYGIYRVYRILRDTVHLEFGEPMAEPIKKEDLPELWKMVNSIAAELGCEPPHNLVLGLGSMFYVTELGVRTSAGTLQGRTLYLSYPLLRQLNERETRGIIGHELAHFIGADAATSAQLYPTAKRIHQSYLSFSDAGIVGIIPLFILSTFMSAFELPLQSIGRKRELEADLVGASVSSNETMSQALLHVSLLDAAWAKLGEMGGSTAEDSLHEIAVNHLLSNPTFMSALTEYKQPHPLDSHPPLLQRLQSLDSYWNAELLHEVAKKLVAARGFQDWFGDASSVVQHARAEFDKFHEMRQLEFALQKANGETLQDREFLETHLPLRSFHGKRWYKYCALALFLIPGLLLVRTIFLVDDLGISGFFVFCGTVFLLLGFVYWQNHFRASLFVDAYGIAYSGFRERLEFREIQNLVLEKHNGALYVRFWWRNRQKRIWKSYLLPFKRRAEMLTLEGLNGSAAEIGLTLLSYYHRAPLGLRSEEKNIDKLQVAPSQTKPIC